MPRAKKFLKWTNENMEAAIAAFTAGGISYRDAANQFSVPKSTLRDRITGRVEHGTKNGPENKLTTEDEDKLAAYLIETSRQGYGKSKQIIMFMATQMAIKRGKKIVGGGLSEMWWRSFLKRHPEISLRATQNFGMVRSLVSRPTIESFYERLLTTMSNNGVGNLLDNPQLVFNADESGFEFDAINKIVAAAKGATHVPRISKGQHEKVTVLACASAAGSTIPPMFIFKSLSGRVPNGVQEGAPAGTLFVAQKSGWIDKDLFLKWFREDFLKFIPCERPVLLIVDGHKAHVTQDVIETAVQNNIIIFCLPAHASHLLQPLDLSLFGPLKLGWVKACAAFHHLTSVVVNQRNFAKLFNVAWHASATPDVIRGGFRRSGIFPYNPAAFDYSKLAPSKAQFEIQASSSPPVVESSCPLTPEVNPFIPTTETSSCLQPMTFTPTPFSDPFDNQLPTQPLSTTSPVMQISPTDPPQMGWLTDTLASSVSGTPSPCLSSANINSLGELEMTIGEEQRERFRRRYENGFDITTDHTYNQWRELRQKVDHQVVTSGGMCPCKSACSCSCRGVGFCSCIGSVVPSPPPPIAPPAFQTSLSPGSSIPEFQSATSPPLTPLSTSKSPTEYTISTPNGDVQIDPDLCSIMLRPAVSSRGSKKRKRKSIDPGNKCITGTIFLEAVRAETKRKEEEEKEKKEKKSERARLAEEKKKKAEEKKKKAIEKKKKAEEKKEERMKKKAEKEKNAPIRKSAKGRATKKVKRVEDILEERYSYCCKSCNKEYAEEEEWVECDFCDSWFHVSCTSLPVLDRLGDNVDFTCNFCEEQGFPSHEKA